MLGASSLVALGAASAAQVEHWRSGLALYQRALEVTDANFFAQWAVGTELIWQGRADEADPYLREAIRLRPMWFEPRRDLGRLLLRRGDFAQAADELGEAVALAPADPEVRAIYAAALWRLGDAPAATRTLAEGIERAPPEARPALERLRVRLSRDGAGLAP